jgi:AraC family transcriptional regulator
MSAEPLRFAPTRFPAHVARTRAAGGFLLSETRYESEATLPMHAHDYACLVVVLEGCFEERCDAKRRTVAPGSLIVRPHREPHSNQFAPGGGRCLNVELPPKWSQRRRDLAIPSAILGGGSLSLMGRRLHLALIRGANVSPTTVEGLVTSVLGEAARAAGRSRMTGPRWLIRTRERLQHDYASRLTLEALADDARVHPVHLATSFRRFFGQTVGAMIRQLRIEVACRELSSTDSPIADVALAAGFCDQSHLGRTFRRELNVTPAAYRAALRGAAAP